MLLSLMHFESSKHACNKAVAENSSKEEVLNYLEELAKY